MQITLIIIFVQTTLMTQARIKELIILALLTSIKIHITIIKKVRIIMMINLTNKIKFLKNNKKT